RQARSRGPRHRSDGRAGDHRGARRIFAGRKQRPRRDRLRRASRLEHSQGSAADRRVRAVTEKQQVLDAVGEGRIRAPTRRNRKLEKFLDAVNADDELKGWWYVAQVNADRLGMSDHSWIHIQIVVNIALRIFRLLVKKGVEPDVVTHYGMKPNDA